MKDNQINGHFFAVIVSILLHSVRSEPFHLTECVTIVARQIESRSSRENVDVSSLIVEFVHPTIIIAIPGRS
jgi:hypothetical protein